MPVKACIGILLLAVALTTASCITVEAPEAPDVSATVAAELTRIAGEATPHVPATVTTESASTPTMALRPTATSHPVLTDTPRATSTPQPPAPTSTNIVTPDPPMNVWLTPQSPTRMLIQWEAPDEIDAGIRIFRNDIEIASLNPGATSYEDPNLSANTRYAYKIVAGRQDESDAVAESSAATLAYQPRGANARNIDWTRLEFYIVDERNPDYTEYHIALRYPGGATVAVSDWGDSKCRSFDALSPRTRYGFSVVAKNLDGVVTAPVDRRAGEGSPHPESFQTRTYETSYDPWVAARVNDLVEIYGLTEAGVDWLSNGVRIEWKRGLPGWAGYADGGYVGIGHSYLNALMHEAMHGFWATWQGWQKNCDLVNFYTFKRDQAQFMLDFREYDRSRQPNPWEAWRPYYNYLVGILAGDAEKVDIGEVFGDRDFYKVGGFYHQQETIFPAHAARKLSLVPPPLQKYFQGFLKPGDSRTWADEIDWYSRLEEADHHLWNKAFATRDILYHSPEMGAPRSAARTKIPEPLRSALRKADRQLLVDFINTLEDVERHDDSDPDSGFWRSYVKEHLFIAQFYLPELNRMIGIELEQPNLNSIRTLLGYLATDLYCGTRTAAEAREVITSANNISQLQRAALLKMVDVYDRGERFPCVDWTP